ncbi:MAG: ATP-binding protein [Alistipes sp.]|nr:ATP-binding protein [Alistipes sp.]
MQGLQPYSFLFNSVKRFDWLNTIVQARKDLLDIPPREEIKLYFSGFEVGKMTPFHIVSLACLIECIIRSGRRVRIKSDKEITKYLQEELQFEKYWGKNAPSNFVESQNDTVLNLWRFVDDEKEAYTMRIHQYLKRRFFENKDLSAVKESLDEAYYNVSDHANADGNAFSFIKFDEQQGKLYVAVCDFGIGIANSIRRVFTDIDNDAQALCKALEYNITTKSHERNQGMGLGNIKDTCTEDDILGIISNNGWLLAKRENIRNGLHKIDFDGTIIYYELSLNHFEEENILDAFTFTF